eukprot:scaffold55494_cov75-Phaeocystis_antarctica.AAC.2
MPCCTCYVHAHAHAHARWVRGARLGRLCRRDSGNSRAAARVGTCWQPPRWQRPQGGRPAPLSALPPLLPQTIALRAGSSGAHARSGLAPPTAPPAM